MYWNPHKKQIQKYRQVEAGKYLQTPNKNICKMWGTVLFMKMKAEQ